MAAISDGELYDVAAPGGQIKIGGPYSELKHVFRFAQPTGTRQALSWKTHSNLPIMTTSILRNRIRISMSAARPSASLGRSFAIAVGIASTPE